MGFFTALFGAIAESENASKKRKRDSLEKEMDFYGLDESEREWVRKGDYDPSAFEEEDLGEEDYYYDDTEDD
jgi:hypothetical protein